MILWGLLGLLIKNNPLCYSFHYSESFVVPLWLTELFLFGRWWAIFCLLFLFFSHRRIHVIIQNTEISWAISYIAVRSHSFSSSSIFSEKLSKNELALTNRIIRRYVILKLIFHKSNRNYKLWSFITNDILISFCISSPPVSVIHYCFKIIGARSSSTNDEATSTKAKSRAKTFSNKV